MKRAKKFVQKTLIIIIVLLYGRSSIVNPFETPSETIANKRDKVWPNLTTIVYTNSYYTFFRIYWDTTPPPSLYYFRTIQIKKKKKWLPKIICNNKIFYFSFFFFRAKNIVYYRTESLSYDNV